MTKQSTETESETGIQSSNRPCILNSTSLLGGCGSLNDSIAGVFTKLAGVSAKSELDSGSNFKGHNDPQGLIYSACLQCPFGCSIKCNVVDGVLVRIDSNPFCPQSGVPNLSSNSRLAEGGAEKGKTCLKGQNVLEDLYDPHRLRKVLKRKPGTKRGGGEWVSISFVQAIREIVDGGDLFSKGNVDGLKDVYVLRDRAVARELASDTERVRKGELSLEDFKVRHHYNLKYLIDPDHPDLGPKNNQFVFLAGRIEHGRKELLKWFTNACFGSVNNFQLTDNGEQSHHIAFEQVTNQWNDGKWTKGKQHMKPDISNARFVIFFGTGFAEANFGPSLLSKLTSESQVNTGMKIAVVDPRLSKPASEADTWIPIMPGGDGAFAMGMLRWMIENHRYDKKFLKNANAAAAAADGETAWTTATYLVKLEQGRATSYLRANEVGLGTDQQFVVMYNGELIAVDPNSQDEVVEGDLKASYDIQNITAKTAFLLLAERTREMTIEEYAEFCGVVPQAITDMACEFTSYGKQAVAEFYRGPVQHTNGYYNAQALIYLNLLVGNSGWKGGMAVGGSHWHEFGGKPGNPFNFSKLHPDKFPTFGIKSNREQATYESSTMFNDYPAKRPWYPFTGNLYQEVVPSAGDEYPYGIKVLFLHKGTPAFACPTGHKQIAILKDTTKIPLFIACDLVIGESSMYADYIIPDTAIWERWGTPHVTPGMLTTVSKVRQPVVAPLVETTNVDGVEMPISLEAFLISVAKQLELPGFGNDTFGQLKSLNRPEDWFLKAVVNIAMGDKENDAVPAADDREMEIFRQARRHLPDYIFNEKRWELSCGEEYWPHVVYVLNRGGRFEDFSRRHNGEVQAHPFKGVFQLFIEKVAKGKNSITGVHFDGLPRIEGPTFANGVPVADDSEYPFKLITYKEIIAGHSRTMPGNMWLGELLTENAVVINRSSAERKGFKDGDLVRLCSPTNPDGKYDLGTGEIRHVQGKLRLVDGMRPGVVAVSLHFGHWAYGSRDVILDGELIKGDKNHSRGLVPNPVMLEDISIGNVCLTDPIGGSASFFDTPVKLNFV